MADTAQLWIAARHGDGEARDELLALVYEELKRTARNQLRRGPRGNFVTTELVHEAFVKLYSGSGARAHDRPHFLALAARAMRQVLIDHFRARRAVKRGGGHDLETLETLDGAVEEDRGETILALHEALGGLAALDPRMAAIVEYRFFGGMTEMEIADALDISKRTVSREWRQARAWLARELAG